jgi:cytosine/adenosine deaminase-related metal-dependent hydrolase
MARDLGSIEAGKLADLLVVDGNPLEDIRVTDDIAYVVQNGRIYEGGTLAEKLTGDRRLEPFYWATAREEDEPATGGDAPDGELTF